MAKPKDLSNQIFGKLTAIHPTRDNKNRYAWHCQCDCGNTHTVLTNYLTSGQVTSCGCYKIDNPPRKTHGKSTTRIYSIFKGMHRRCTDTNHTKSVKNYINRGITVCDEWQDLAVFEQWALANGYADNLSLERKNENIGYSPDNCIWATATTQSRHRRKSLNTSSKYIGVSYRKDRNTWQAIVNVNNKKVFNKSFKSEKEAAEARDKYIIDNNLKGFTFNF